jgi:hypothetical protein
MTIHTTCHLGFVLRDLNQELCARFTNELLIRDKNATSLASTHITTRASLGAYIGEGNTHFYKYSLLSQVYLLIQVILEEAKKLYWGQMKISVMLGLRRFFQSQPFTADSIASLKKSRLLNLLMLPRVQEV